MWTCVACLLARAFNIYSLSYLYNISHRGSSERLFGEEMERRKTTGSVGGGLDKLCAAKGEGTDAEKEEDMRHAHERYHVTHGYPFLEFGGHIPDEEGREAQ